MHTIEATYRIVTPMFCAGADQQSAELRLSSFKGALRFWWRSLMWGKVGDHRELRDEEAALFGASDSRFGQSKVQMRVVSKELAQVEKPRAVFEQGKLAGAHYLGYGVMEAFASRRKGTKAGQLTRAMIPSGSFTIECRFLPFAKHEETELVRKALILLGTVGGLGSKSRKGFGSLTLTELQQDGSPIALPESPQERLRELLPERSESLPTWTAWSRLSRVIAVRAANASSPTHLLDLIGREQVHFRSWGRDGKVLGRDSERNFPHDHDLSKGQRAPFDYPLRIAFGLPHNYGKGDSAQVRPTMHDRRASALFIHVHQTREKGRPVAILAFLPAQFLPAGERLRAFGREVALNVDDSFWFPVHAFLDRLLADGSEPSSRPGYEYFPAGSNWWKKHTALTAQEVPLG